MKKNKGITLITLVITIIVLIILAAVSLATLTGDNGLINRAIQARKNTDISNTIEQIQVDISEALTENVLEENKGKITQSQLKNILEKYGTLDYSDDILDGTLTTEKGNIILISDIYMGSLLNEENRIDGIYILDKNVTTFNGFTRFAGDSGTNMQGEMTESGYYYYGNYTGTGFTSRYASVNSVDLTNYNSMIVHYRATLNDYGSTPSNLRRYINIGVKTSQTSYDPTYSFWDGYMDEPTGTEVEATKTIDISSCTGMWYLHISGRNMNVMIDYIVLQ